MKMNVGIRIRTLSAALPLLLVLNVACHHAPEKVAKDKSAKTLATEARDISKWIRSHNLAYWTFAKENLAQIAPKLTDYLQYEGMLVGDAHLANFSSIPVTLDDGTVAMRYLDIDFDDAGHGPFVLDAARLMITSKATKPALSSTEVLASYVKGLRGETMETPMVARHILEKSLDDYAHQYDVYVADKTDRKSFKYKPGKTEAYTGPVNADMLQPFFPGMKIVDIAQRPVDKGGSAGFLRLWVYLKTPQGRAMIYELKQLEPSALASFEAQPTILDWKNELLGIYLAGIRPESLDLIDLGPQGHFWRREKKATLINIAYKSQKSEDVAYVQQLSDYDAYYLGQLHGKQPGGQALAARFTSDADVAALADAIRPFEQAFIELAMTKIASEEKVGN